MSDRPAAGDARVQVCIYMDGVGELYVSADPAELRRAYGRELKEDGMFDAPDEKLIEHVYNNNPDAALLSVEDAW